MAMTEQLPRFAILSHTLPPSPSGQAMVLRQLLGKINPDRYCLLSRINYEDTMESAISRHWLKPALLLPELGPRWFSAATAIINAIIGISLRARQIEQIIRQKEIGLLIACSGDLYDIPAAALAAKRVGIPFIPYLFDDYIFQWTGYYRTLASALGRFAFRYVDRAIVPNEFLQQEYQSRYKMNCTVIRNPCMPCNLALLDQAEPEFNTGESAIVYTGAVYHANYDAFRNLIAAIARLNRDEVRLHIYTSQPEDELRTKGIYGPMVVYHQHIPQAEVPRILRQATVLFLPLAFETTIPEVIRTSAPGKTGEYLASGRPILVHAPEDSFISWYFREHGCGVVVGKNDQDLLTAEVTRLLDDPALQKRLGTAARQRAEKEFDVAVISEEFARFITCAQDGVHAPC